MYGSDSDTSEGSRTRSQDQPDEQCVHWLDETSDALGGAHSLERQSACCTTAYNLLHNLAKHT